jgi:hypothetical protein
MSTFKNHYYLNYRKIYFVLYQICVIDIDIYCYNLIQKSILKKCDETICCRVFGCYFCVMVDFASRAYGALAVASSTSAFAKIYLIPRRAGLVARLMTLVEVYVDKKEI